MKRFLKTTALWLLCAMLLSAAMAEAGAVYDGTVGGWHFTVEDVMVRASMQNVTVELGYTDVQTDEFVQEAPEGKTYCLVKLRVEKAGSREKIEWENMALTDGQGREYRRIDDEFIQSLGMKRLPGTALNFGVNEGWIAFEIDADAADLTLSYPFEGEAFSCALGL